MGIADSYPYDINISNDPDVVLAQGFENAAWYSELGGEGGYWGSRGDRTTESAAVYYGNYGFKYENIEGEHSPGPIEFILDSEYDEIYIRFYRKYSSGYDFTCQVKTDGIFAFDDPEDHIPAGQKPDGTDKIELRLQLWDYNSGTQGEPKFYCYNLDQPGNYGETLAQNQGSPVYISSNTWYCFEYRLKLDTVTGGVSDGNGIIEMWIDGVKKGSYTDMAFRTTTDLQINFFTLTAYVGGECTASQDQEVYEDLLVIAESYIGPMATTEPETPAPSENNLVAVLSG